LSYSQKQPLISKDGKLKLGLALPEKSEVDRMYKIFRIQDQQMSNDLVNSVNPVSKDATFRATPLGL
jgi:hypothetical protein